MRATVQHLGRDGIPIVLTRASSSSAVPIGAKPMTYAKPARSSSATRVSLVRRARAGTRIASRDAITAR